jgi:two-component system chemotaxis response regulator CheY
MSNIFVVDDEVFIQNLYGDLLVHAGHAIVDSAYNGAEAVARYAALAPPPDIVIMDHRMPVKSGLDATREIVAMDHDARVLVVSADQTVRDKVAGAGAAGFMEKPFTVSALLQAIDRVVEGRPATGSRPPPLRP